MRLSANAERACPIIKKRSKKAVFPDLIHIGEKTSEATRVTSGDNEKDFQESRLGTSSCFAFKPEPIITWVKSPASTSGDF